MNVSEAAKIVMDFTGWNVISSFENDRLYYILATPLNNYSDDDAAQAWYIVNQEGKIDEKSPLSVMDLLFLAKDNERLLKSISKK